MKKNTPSANNFWLYWLVVIVFIGCMTAKKAEKAVKKFPEVAEKTLLNGLSRVNINDTVTTYVTDSTEYLNSLKKATEEAKKQNATVAGMIEKLKLTENEKRVCADILLINDALVEENRTLNRLMANMKPVRVIEEKKIWWEDTLKVRLYKNELNITKDILARTIAEMDKVKAELKTFTDKAKGNWTLYLPKWILWAVVAALVFVFRKRLGKLNPITLLKKGKI